MGAGSRDGRGRTASGAAARWGSALAVGLLLAGCAVPRFAPEGDEGAEPVPTATGGAASGAPAAEDGEVAGFAAVERAAVRVRNVQCGSGIATGSGFAVDEHTVITNQHVVDGAETIQVSTFDGQELEVRTASISRVADLAVVRTVKELPAHVPLASADPAVGDAVSIIGFPSGGPMPTSTGAVLALTDDPLQTMDTPVLATDAPVEHGSSGSAVLDAQGQVVGVVYAGATQARQSFAVPVSVLADLLADQAVEGEPACG